MSQASTDSVEAAEMAHVLAIGTNSGEDGNLIIWDTATPST